MDKYTIYPDLEIAKRRRAHATAAPGDQDHRWHSDFVTCLQEAMDAGHTEISVVGENVTYHLTISGVADTLDYAPKAESPEAPDANPSQEI